jgi:hypothetical protein
MGSVFVYWRLEDDSLFKPPAFWEGNKSAEADDKDSRYAWLFPLEVAAEAEALSPASSPILKEVADASAPISTAVPGIVQDISTTRVCGMNFSIPAVQVRYDITFLFVFVCLYIYYRSSILRLS